MTNADDMLIEVWEQLNAMQTAHVSDARTWNELQAIKDMLNDHYFNASA